MAGRYLTTAGAIALASMAAAGGAFAAPAITGVEVTKTGTTTLEVDVETERGDGTARPRILVSSPLVRVNRARAPKRTLMRARARVERDDWSDASAPDDLIVATAVMKRVRQPTGKKIRLRIRACDNDGCITRNRWVTVLDEDDAAGEGASTGTDDAAVAAAPLPPGSITADGAIKVALEAIGPLSTLIKIERADEYGAAWEVKVRRADGAHVKVYVAADGTVARIRVDDDDDDHDAPPPPGGIGPDEAVAIALAHVGAGSTLVEIEREDDDGVAWEVKVRSAAGVIWEVELAPNGTVVDAEIDD